VAELRRAVRARTATLLFAARDEEHNNAVALAEYLGGRKTAAHTRTQIAPPSS
jgi:uncharacterized protein YeaO (DUF488 family)